MKRVRCLSDDLVEVSFDDQAATESAATRLRRDGDWLEVVTGIDTLTVQFDSLRVDVDEALRRLRALDDTPVVESAPVETLDIPVCYATAVAPDLDAVCETLALDRDTFIRLHTAARHEVRLIGFAPGFAYLDGLDSRLDVPRRAKPRQKVSAGSIAIAGGQTGIYSLQSPGGWQVIGRTPIALFDAHATPPMRLVAGQRVRFYAISVEQFESMTGS